MLERERNWTVLFSERKAPKALWVNKCATKAKEAFVGYKKKEAAAIYAAKGINSNNYHPTLQSERKRNKKEKFGGQSVKSEEEGRKALKVFIIPRWGL